MQQSETTVRGVAGLVFAKGRLTYSNIKINHNDFAGKLHKIILPLLNLKLYY